MGGNVWTQRLETFVVFKLEISTTLVTRGHRYLVSFAADILYGTFGGTPRQYPLLDETPYSQHLRPAWQKGA